MSDVSLRHFYDTYYRPLQIPQASPDLPEATGGG